MTKITPNSKTSTLLNWKLKQLLCTPPCQRRFDNTKSATKGLTSQFGRVKCGHKQNITNKINTCIFLI